MKQQKKRSHIPIRLNVLFSIVVILFGALTYKLIDLQLFNYKYYSNIITSSQAVTTTTDMTRGQIYDRNGVLLVGNQSFKTVDYTRYDNSVQNMLTLAKQLITIVDLADVTITTRQLKDYWMQLNAETLDDRMTAQEKKLTGVELVEAKLSKVSDADIAYNDAEKKVAYLFSKMYNTGFLQTTTLKNKSVTNQEIARISEQLTTLNGISIGTTWERTYPHNDVLRDLFGSVSSQQAGLPEKDQNKLLAKGYARNSRVGTSMLEQQYDAVLRGTPKTVATTLNANGVVMDSKTVYEGKSGSNLYLSIDLNVQKKLEEVLANHLYSMPDTRTAVTESIFAVIQKAKTGEILAISGKQFEYDKNEDKLVRHKVVNNNVSAITSAYSMGSTVKPATVTAGYQHGVITEQNNVLLDAPMYFSAEVSMSSVFNRGGSIKLDVETALARSSNVYMAKIAMKLGGQDYQPGVPLALSDDAMSKLRKTFSQYGLGVYTGIDLPIDNRGLIPSDYKYFSPLYEAIGQYDNYTTLQVSQFMATIANGGYRYAPKMVLAIREANQIDGLGKVAYDASSKLLNRVDITPQQMKLIHNGLYDVTHASVGTSQQAFEGFGIPVSGKTGTAEALYNGRLQAMNGKYVINSTFASFAPSYDPDIVVTVVIPNLSFESEYATTRADDVARKIYEAYYFNR